MTVIFFYGNQQTKYLLLILLLHWIENVKTLCNMTQQGWKNEEYQECERVYKWGAWRNECEQKYKKTVIGPTIFSCTNTSIQEVYSSNQDYETKNNFIVKNSYLNDLVVDGKKWPRLTKLTIENGNLSSIIPGFFNGFVELLELSITKNKISNIIDGVFSSLANLQILNLTENQITYLGTHAFIGLSELNTLDLSRNEIVDLTPNTFLALKKLNYLYVSENKIASLENNFNLSSLKKINLDRNNLQKVNFHDVPKDHLEILDLSHNNISEIKHLETFKAGVVNLAFNNIKSVGKIGQITKFNISNNKLNVLDNEFASSSVIKLDLSFNFIAKISINAFLKSNQLTTLFLNNNTLKMLPIASFKSLYDLEYLDLSFNNLLHLEFGTFDNNKKIKYLNISHNRGFFDFHVFARLPVLENIDFEENKINNFDVFFLDSHKNIKHIRMGNNSWSCSDLVKMLLLLESRNISVFKGNTEHVSNINGIACNNILKPNNSLVEKPNITVTNDHTTIISVKENTISTTMKYEYFNSFFHKIVNSLNDIEHNLNYSKNLKIDDPQRTPFLTKSKIEENNHASISNWLNTMNLVFCNLFLLIILCILVVLVKTLKEIHRKRSKEEVELIG